MKRRAAIQVLALAVIVVGAALWWRARAAAVDLQARLVALAAEKELSLAPHQQRDRLRIELDRALAPREAAIAATRLPAPAPAVTADKPVPFSVGEWRSAREWQNQGSGTPRDAVTTLLWTAAEGDPAAMAQLFEFDEAARQRAQALLASLPPGSAAATTTPETLVAMLTMNAIPTEAAQLSWFHQRDDDHATVGLMLAHPESKASEPAQITPAEGGRPPEFAGRRQTQLAVLSLHRSAAGWRVIVPVAAIDNLARRLKAPGK